MNIISISSEGHSLLSSDLQAYCKLFCAVQYFTSARLIGQNSPAGSLILTVVPSISRLRDEQHDVVAGQKVQQARPAPCASGLWCSRSVSEQGFHPRGSWQRQHPGQTGACPVGYESKFEISLWLCPKSPSAPPLPIQKGLHGQYWVTSQITKSKALTRHRSHIIKRSCWLVVLSKWIRSESVLDQNLTGHIAAWVSDPRVDHYFGRCIVGCDEWTIYWIPIFT